MRSSVRLFLFAFAICAAMGFLAARPAVAGSHGSCTACHGVHGGMTATPCTDCHNGADPAAPVIDLSLIQHPSSPDTPLEGTAYAACKVCHMAGGLHLFKINTNQNYTTPADARWSSDEWVDLDHVCGQCHSEGGVAHVMNKPTMSLYALNMHGVTDHVPASAYFGYRYDGVNTLTILVDASDSTCDGSNANCDAFDWDWGDGTAHGAGVTASHGYASAGTYEVTLTVDLYGITGASRTHPVTVYAPDLPPVVGGTCSFDANTWTATISDASTDDNAVKQVTVNWGDGSMIASDTAAPFGPFSRAYLNAGTYTITHTAIDSIGQQSQETCTVAPSLFTIGGTVYRSNGTTAVPSAIVTLKKGTTVVRTAYTASNGTFSIGSLKPAAYTIAVTKSGYTFQVPAAAITVGPNSNGNRILAIAP